MPFQSIYKIAKKHLPPPSLIHTGGEGISVRRYSGAEWHNEAGMQPAGPSVTMEHHR